MQLLPPGPGQLHLSRWDQISPTLFQLYHRRVGLQWSSLEWGCLCMYHNDWRFSPILSGQSETSSSSSSSNFIPNRIQTMKDRTIETHNNNHKHWWSCWWSPEKPEAHRAGNQKRNSSNVSPTCCWRHKLKLRHSITTLVVPWECPFSASVTFWGTLRWASGNFKFKTTFMVSSEKHARSSAICCSGVGQQVGMKFLVRHVYYVYNQFQAIQM